ncbi:double-strand-break repair protein rad21-like protein 1 [Odontesthes bonariensis]
MLFYTQLFTSKRGPLAKIWLAAHWERKLTKAHVFECNLETTIRDIISPKMKIGLRTSGHLLLGVVKIYSRKAKYLLADCSDALVRIKMAFRPGQTDMPVEGLEATIKAITLIEDFTAFDAQLPHPSDIDVVDHFSQNQSRSEEITLKEDFGNGFLGFTDIDESLGQSNGLLDRSFESFAQNGDTFGDEDKGFDLLDFLTNSSDHAESTDFILDEPQNQESSTRTDEHQTDADLGGPTETRTPTLNETTLLANEEVAFALEPVAITPNSEKQIGKRKRKLVVDQTKELSNEFIREQLSDYSDLVSPLDMAPPTVELMQWKEGGSTDKLFSQPCSTIVNPQIKELFAKSIFQVKCYSVGGEVEEMRQEGQEAQRDLSTLTTDNVSVVDSSVGSERAHNAQLTALSQMTNFCETNSELEQCESRSEFTHPDLPSEDSMFVHPSVLEQDTQSTSLHTQSMLDSQDFEERRITRRAQKLLSAIKQSQSDRDLSFSLKALCEGSTRSQAAATFFCLLVLKKQQALHLHQSAPYGDIVATPGPKFYD